MFPNVLLQRFLKSFKIQNNGDVNLSVDNSAHFISTPTVVTGDVTGQTVLTPTLGTRIIIKGLTILSQGDGDILLKRSSDDSIILPVYGSKYARASTSSSLNVKLNVDETIYVDISGNLTNDTFIGISYIETE